MTILLNDIDSNQEAFEKIHAGRFIGSSRIAAVCGLNKYCSRLQVWQEMTSEKGPEFDEDQKLNMWLGHKMEPVIGELFEKKTLLMVARANQVFTYEPWPVAIASPDFYVFNKDDSTTKLGILEAKNANHYVGDQWEDEIPDSAHCQIQWQMGICGIEKAWVAALIGGDARRFKFQEIPFSPELFKQLLTQAQDFYNNYVLTGIPPLPSADDGKLIDSMVVRDLAGCTELAAELIPGLERYEEIKKAKATVGDQLATLTRDQKEIENKIKVAMGTAIYAICGGRQIKLNNIIAKAKKDTKVGDIISDYWTFKVTELATNATPE